LSELVESLRIKYIGICLKRWRRRRFWRNQIDYGFPYHRTYANSHQSETAYYYYVYDETSFDRPRIRGHVHFSRVIRGNRKWWTTLRKPTYIYIIYGDDDDWARTTVMNTESSNRWNDSGKPKTQRTTSFAAYASTPKQERPHGLYQYNSMQNRPMKLRQRQ